jgi:hypothetical protein
MNNNNSNKVLYGIIGVVLLFFVLIAGAYLYQQNKDKTTNNQNDTSTSDTTSDDSQVSVTSFESEKGVAVTLTSPTRGGTVASPLSVAGMVPGSWSQEGQFTLRLLDADSNVLTEGAAKLDGDWMTENQVPFTATLTFENAPAVGSSGILILEKANPSGMEENADSVSVPILF